MRIVLGVISIIIILLGYFQGKYPREVWRMLEGWKYEAESEPKEWYLKYQSVSGIIAAVVGIIFLLIALFSPDIR